MKQGELISEDRQLPTTLISEPQAGALFDEGAKVGEMPTAQPTGVGFQGVRSPGQRLRLPLTEIQLHLDESLRRLVEKQVDPVAQQSSAGVDSSHHLQAARVEASFAASGFSVSCAVAPNSLSLHFTLLSRAPAAPLRDHAGAVPARFFTAAGSCGLEGCPYVLGSGPPISAARGKKRAPEKSGASGTSFLQRRKAATGRGGSRGAPTRCAGAARGAPRRLGGRPNAMPVGCVHPSWALLRRGYSWGSKDVDRDRLRRAGVGRARSRRSASRAARARSGLPAAVRGSAPR